MPGKPDRHDWNELNTYLLIHEAYLDRAMGDGFVISHDVANPLVLPDTVVLEGRINCQNGIFIDVDKQLEVMFRQRRPYVRTHRYNYQAMIEGTEPRPIFRYDNAHAYSGHADHHHKHCVDYRTWTYIEPPQWIGHANWPHLSDVIDELQNWWLNTGWRLNL